MDAKLPKLLVEEAFIAYSTALKIEKILVPYLTTALSREELAAFMKAE